MMAQISYLINNAESASVPNEIERFLQVSLRELHYAAQTLDTGQPLEFVRWTFLTVISDYAHQVSPREKCTSPWWIDNLHKTYNVCCKTQNKRFRMNWASKIVLYFLNASRNCNQEILIVCANKACHSSCATETAIECKNNTIL